MFDLDEFVSQCVQAVNGKAEPRLAVKEVLERAPAAPPNKVAEALPAHRPPSSFPSTLHGEAVRASRSCGRRACGSGPTTISCGRRLASTAGRRTTPSTADPAPS